MTPENRSGITWEIVISATIAALADALVSVLLSRFTTLDWIIVIIAGIPGGILVYLGVRKLYQRKSMAKKNTSASLYALPVHKKVYDKNTLDILAEMGLISGNIELENSNVDPINCMKQTQRNLDFMGIFGSKWVTIPVIRAEFVNFLKRIDGRKGLVRFLLLDPDSISFQKLHGDRLGAISPEVLDHWNNLCKEFSCLEVRLYSQYPCFRLVFIDGKCLALSRYHSEREEYYKSRFGWDAPNLLFDADSPWSLFDAFALYFGEVWSTSKKISDRFHKKVR
jgi:hypothetical protein